MNLLFITQKIDAGDDLLGAYHEWVRRLALHRLEGGAPQFEKIHVIALMVGDYALPRNVFVHSLGKEDRRSRLQYLARFFGYAWRLRNEYDAVFVHMNTEYVVLGWWLWRLLGKRTVLWFAHYRPDWKLRFAEKVVDAIVTSVPEACAITSRKVVAMGQAIDTAIFRDTGAHREKNSLLFLGRIAPVKKLEILIDAFAEIKTSFPDFMLHIVGEPGEKDRQYAESIRERIAGRDLSRGVVFRGKVAHAETPALYNRCEVFVNLTPTGSFDKTILEAMACETVVVVSNRAYERIFPEDLRNILLFRENDGRDLARKLEIILRLPPEEKKRIGGRLRECVVGGHGMDRLIRALAAVLRSPRG